MSLMRASRCYFFSSLCLLSAIALFGGCSEDQKDKVLHKGQTFNDRVQSSVFSEQKLAPTYSDADITPESGFRVNGKDDNSTVVDPASYKLEIKGLVKKPGMFSIEQIKSFPKHVENVRHVCVEGWSIIPKWGGARLSDVLDAAGVDANAKYLLAECADGYYVPYDMASVRHPQTLLCYEAYNKPLTPPHGAPIRIVMPTKLGYKSAKWVTKLTVTNTKPGGYWEDQGYDWFGGL